MTDEEREHLATCLSKRILDRVPVPYLTHEALFCDLPFYVDERVLIPRSPVAELIKTQFEPWINCEKVTSILDLCTGSGCIAIACCYAFPEAAVDAVDLSKEALVVAEFNRQKLGVEAQLELIQSDCFDEIPTGKRYNVIISNPPYVGLEELESLPKEYAHEPRIALWADRNGLEIVERILNSAASYLHDEGILIVEVGASDALLSETYPEVPFTWLDFAEGGEGVFLLTKAQLLQYFNSKN
ncbi:MAG: ribosomal protein L3 N(5)-glutamine methyltransferase [Legionella sp. 21-45-4]|nr:MAG: ribosomal protein L3 N(5)-glutamine methyltransferase [Legionella sp. 21-45-4]